MQLDVVTVSRVFLFVEPFTISPSFHRYHHGRPYISSWRPPQAKCLGTLLASDLTRLPVRNLRQSVGKDARKRLRPVGRTKIVGSMVTRPMRNNRPSSFPSVPLIQRN